MAGWCSIDGVQILQVARVPVASCHDGSQATQWPSAGVEVVVSTDEQLRWTRIPQMVARVVAL